MTDIINDELIRDQILSILHFAYRNPRGKYLMPTLMVIWQEVRKKISCSREDIVREIEYLAKHKWIEPNKKRYEGYKIGNMKAPSGYTEYYKLSVTGIDLFENPGKYSKNITWKTQLPELKIVNSTINGNVTVGSNNNISYNAATDIDKIMELIGSHNIIESQKTELIKLIRSELPPILDNPNTIEGKKLVDRIKSFGQVWLVPIITQLIASYLSYKIGLPPQAAILPTN